MRGVRIAAASAALAVALVAGIAGPAWAPPQTTQISGSAFSPQTHTAPAIGYFAWDNQDGVTHTATANKPFKVFDTGDIAASSLSSYVYPAGPGMFPYHCKIHPFMTGVLDLTPYVTGTLTTGSPQTISFAWTAAAPAGMNREVQLKAPGKRWKTIYEGHSANSVTKTFSSPGTYKVRGRMEIRRSGKTTEWSSTYSFSIS